jgi:mannose-1-phosphate guanylyltransferase
MVEGLLPTIGTPRFDAALALAYGQIEKISVDYAIMEKAPNLVVARGAFAWDDVGAWPALANHFTPDANGNVVIGGCEARDASGNIVVSQNRLTALLGVRDLVVVHGDGATLVCSRDRAQDVKQLVAQVGSKPEYEDLI